MERAGRPSQGLCCCRLISWVLSGLCTHRHDGLPSWLVPPGGGRQEEKQLQGVPGLCPGLLIEAPRPAGSPAL